VNPTFPNASEAFRALNPHLFGDGPALRPAQPQPNPGQPPRPPESQAGCQGRRGRHGAILQRSSPPSLRVVLTAFVHRPRDDDNLASSYKHVRDAIADQLTGHRLAPGVADELIDWEYYQHATRGPECTVVLIQVIP